MMKRKDKNSAKNKLTKKRNSVFRLIGYVWRFAPELFFVKSIIILLHVIIDVYLNISLTKVIVDAVASGQSFSYVVRHISIGSVILLIDILLESTFSEYINTKAKRKIYRGVHTIIFSKIRSVDLKNYDDSEFYNDYIWALERADSEVINSFENLMKLIAGIIRAGAMITVIVSSDAVVLIFIVIPILINLFVGMYQNSINYKYEKEVNPYSRKKNYTKRVFYLKQYAKELKSFSADKILLKNLIDSTDNEIAVLKKHKNKKILSSALLNASGGIVQMVILLLYLAYQAIVKMSYSAGTIASMISAVNMLSANLGNIFNTFPKFQKSELYAEKIFKIIDYESEIEEQKSDNKVEVFNSIELKNVSFKYDFNAEEVIKGLSMKINRGDKIAIVGLNGAGKSTLINLLLHFYNVNNGTILYNDKDINEYSTVEYRKKYSTIFQDFQIYAFSLIENILMKEDISDKEIETATTLLEQVGLGHLKNDLLSVVTKEFNENGLEFSGGEKQKIAILRAMMSSGDVIIMDEASSALDPIAESEINDFIFRYFNDKTMIVVAHRLSTIKNMDYIYYLESGTIAEAGTHEELMALSGKYAKMYNSQKKNYI